MIIPNIWKNNKCSKPPTRWWLVPEGLTCRSQVSHGCSNCTWYGTDLPRAPVLRCTDKALVESSLLVQFWRLLRSRWASSWSTMVLKKNTPRLRNNIQSNAKTASALTAHWCVEASVFTDGLIGHGVYRPSSSFTIEVPDSSSPLISLSCQYSSKVMSHSWLSWFTTRLLILMVDISIGGWGSGPTQKWGGTTLCWCEDFPLSSHQLPEKKLIVSSTKKPSLILTLTAFGYALIAIHFNSYLFPTHPKADLLDHELGWLWMIPPTHISIIYGPRYIQITSEMCFITLGS